MNIHTETINPGRDTNGDSIAFSKLPGHIPQLDGLRGIAILMVLIVHFFRKELFDAAPGIQMGLSRVAGAGGYGVELFFVLSGFLITGILLDNQHEKGALGRFYVRRCLRIFPLYYLTLVVLMLVLPLAIPYDEGAKKIVEHQSWLWTYLVNWPGTGWIWDDSGIFWVGHFWSLCVEEHFYMFWPLIVYALGRTKLIKFCLGLVLIGLLSRLVATMLSPDAPLLLQWTTLSKIDGLAIGSLLALLMRDPGSVRILPEGPAFRRWLWVLGVFFLVHRFWPRRLHTPYIEVFMETIVVVLSALCLIGAIRSRPGDWVHRGLTAPWLMSFGKYSYGLYVIHGILRPQFQRLLPIDSMTSFPGSPFLYQFIYYVITTAFCFGAAYVSYHCFEKHFLRLKQLFPYAKAKATAQAPAIV